jgi:predicted O-linked N-acetylglucosamine transferase (SPINDLY family)
MAALVQRDHWLDQREITMLNDEAAPPTDTALGRQAGRFGLAELVPVLRNYEQVIVSGPQRAGTTIAAKILAGELGYRYVSEEEVDVNDIMQLVELYRVGRRFVVQGPGFCPYVHLLPGAVVLMRRPVKEIVRSQARIRWSQEKVELAGYFTTEGPIAQVKYTAWDKFQKPRLGERAFDLDYHSLAAHPLWIQQEQRRTFHHRQTTLDDAPRAPDSAVTQFQNAVRRAPQDPQAYFRLARALSSEQREAEAVLCFRQALRLKPDFADAYKYLGDSLRGHGGLKVDEAVASYRDAIRVQPDHADAYHMLGRTLKDLGLLDEALEALRRACQLRPDSAKFHSSLLYALHYHPDSDSAALAREHDLWNERHAAPLAAHIQPHSNAPEPRRRLRIGYISPYFRNHPVGRFLVPLFEAHDRREFEIFCYANVRVPDELTARFRIQSDRWHDIDNLDDEGLADLIRGDGIDILVDLDAHTPSNRLLTFARKPAPVQVTYLAYCSTTGLSAMDYRLTDPYLDPVGQPPCSAEESVWLPETYWCYQPSMDLPPVAPLPALVKGQVTFGCLNNFWKVTQPTLTLWRELLQRVPKSKLVLHARPGSHRERVGKFFAESGIESDRIEFVGVTPMPEYFERYHQIDIGLDPFPYGGGTTTCDALWMGVPVITLVGKTAVGRGGASILSNVGLPELVAQTADEYVRIAANLAGDLPRLAALRAGLRDRLLRSPLTNGPRFTHHVEAAFRAMWHRWCNQTNRNAVNTEKISR